MRFVDQQLGRILLAVAVVVAVAVNVLNQAPVVEPESDARLGRPVQVKLIESELATASNEIYYAPDSPVWTAPLDTFVFIPPKTAFVFQPVDLDVPPASIGRAAQILPEPGPSLEGAAKLPRFGDEFPAMMPVGTPPAGSGNATSGAGTSAAPSTPSAPATVTNPFAK
jgi:hypothetical protein